MNSATIHEQCKLLRRLARVNLTAPIEGPIPAAPSYRIAAPAVRNPFLKMVVWSILTKWRRPAK